MIVTKVDTMNKLSNAFQSIADICLLKSSVEVGNYLEAKFVDSAHVFIMDAHLFSSKQFEIIDQNDFIFNSKAIKELLNKMKKDESVSLEFLNEPHGDTPGRITAIHNEILESIGCDLNPDHFELTIPRIPSLTLPNSITLRKELLMPIFSYMETKGKFNRSIEAIELKYSNGKLVITLNPEKPDERKIEIPISHPKIIDCKFEPFRSLFSADYFHRFKPIFILSDSAIKLELNTDYPIRVSTNIFGGNGVLTVHLVPRIESE